MGDLEKRDYFEHVEFYLNNDKSPVLNGDVISMMILFVKGLLWIMKIILIFCLEHLKSLIV